jgi:hypothetical protein
MVAVARYVELATLAVTITRLVEAVAHIIASARFVTLGLTYVDGIDTQAARNWSRAQGWPWAHGWKYLGQFRRDLIFDVLVVSGNQLVRIGATLNIALIAQGIRILEIALATQLTAFSSTAFADADVDSGLARYARIVDLALLDNISLGWRAALWWLHAFYSTCVNQRTQKPRLCFTYFAYGTVSLGY